MTGCMLTSTTAPQSQDELWQINGCSRYLSVLRKDCLSGLAPEGKNASEAGTRAFQ